MSEQKYLKRKESAISGERASAERGIDPFLGMAAQAGNQAMLSLFGRNHQDVQSAERRVDLPAAMQAKMEAAFGADFSNVRLYENPAVADAGAKAVTSGSKISFAPGALDFSSFGGQSLLGHELSHVVSQSRGESRGDGFLDNRSLEAQADRQGAMAAAGAVVYSNASPIVAPPVGGGGPVQAKKVTKEDMDVFSIHDFDPKSTEGMTEAEKIKQRIEENDNINALQVLQEKSNERKNRNSFMKGFYSHWRRLWRSHRRALDDYNNNVGNIQHMKGWKRFKWCISNPLAWFRGQILGSKKDTLKRNVLYQSQKRVARVLSERMTQKFGINLKSIKLSSEQGAAPKVQEAAPKVQEAAPKVQAAAPKPNADSARIDNSKSNSGNELIDDHDQDVPIDNSKNQINLKNGNNRVEDYGSLIDGDDDALLANTERDLSKRNGGNVISASKDIVPEANPDSNANAPAANPDSNANAPAASSNSNAPADGFLDNAKDQEKKGFMERAANLVGTVGNDGLVNFVDMMDYMVPWAPGKFLYNKVRKLNDEKLYRQLGEMPDEMPEFIGGSLDVFDGFLGAANGIKGAYDHSKARADDKKYGDKYGAEANAWSEAQAIGSTAQSLLYLIKSLPSIVKSLPTDHHVVEGLFKGTGVINSLLGIMSTTNRWAGAENRSKNLGNRLKQIKLNSDKQDVDHDFDDIVSQGDQAAKLDVKHAKMDFGGNMISMFSSLLKYVPLGANAAPVMYLLSRLYSGVTGAIKKKQKETFRENTLDDAYNLSGAATKLGEKLGLEDSVAKDVILLSIGATGRDSEELTREFFEKHTYVGAKKLIDAATSKMPVGLGPEEEKKWLEKQKKATEILHDLNENATGSGYSLDRVRKKLGGDSSWKNPFLEEDERRMEKKEEKKRKKEKKKKKKK